MIRISLPLFWCEAFLSSARTRDLTETLTFVASPSLKYISIHFINTCDVIQSNSINYIKCIQIQYNTIKYNKIKYN